MGRPNPLLLKAISNSVQLQEESVVPDLIADDEEIAGTESLLQLEPFDDSSSVLAKQLASQVAMRRKLADLNTALDKRELRYRTLGLQYHTLPLHIRRPKKSIAAHAVCDSAFRVSSEQENMMIQTFRALREHRQEAKLSLWRFHFAEADTCLRELEEGVELLTRRLFLLGEAFRDVEVSYEREVALEEEKIRRGGYVLSTLQRGHAVSPIQGHKKFAEFKSWIVELPEVRQMVERRWGEKFEDLETFEAFSVAVEELNRTLDSKNQIGGEREDGGHASGWETFAEMFDRVVLQPMGEDGAYRA